MLGKSCSGAVGQCTKMTQSLGDLKRYSIKCHECLWLLICAMHHHFMQMSIDSRCLFHTQHKIIQHVCLSAEPQIHQGLNRRQQAASIHLLPHTPATCLPWRVDHCRNRLSETNYRFTPPLLIWCRYRTSFKMFFTSILLNKVRCQFPPMENAIHPLQQMQISILERRVPSEIRLHRS